MWYTYSLNYSTHPFSKKKSFSNTLTALVTLSRRLQNGVALPSYVAKMLCVFVSVFEATKRSWLSFIFMPFSSLAFVVLYLHAQPMPEIKPKPRRNRPVRRERWKRAFLKNTKKGSEDEDYKTESKDEAEATTNGGNMFNYLNCRRCYPDFHIYNMNVYMETVHRRAMESNRESPG